MLSESGNNSLIDKKRQQHPAPFSININDITIYLHEDWDAGIGGGLWSTGLAMAKYFQSNVSSIREDLRRIAKLREVEVGGRNNQEGTSALELGSGNGFLSVCLAAVAHDILSEFVVTDTAEHLDLINKSFSANSHVISPDSADAKADSKMKTIIMEHKWGEFVDENHEVEEETDCSTQQLVTKGAIKFDFIFGTDVAYREYLYSPLISSLKQFSHKHTVSLIGVTMIDTKSKFFNDLREAGFSYDRIADHCMAPEFRNATFGIFAIQKRQTF